ncbi:hypothetical protein [Urbifossiella limnaea]|uniref:Uncharacterized protein n=1 Tax=Urbifossiella limnaea TaxID=2528023 RepID=A0A517XUU7_9BACT|nr:hypothetical protein [Urbifossiella limnaea]QDU21277.1 hypothetical protein ETAA1_32430 [Urbifossiella limnaea]
MTLHGRVARLTRRLPGRRPKGVPTDPAALLAGLAAGTVSMADFDRADADQLNAVAYAAALLIAHSGAGGAR